jgi:muramoyltetrapeptide carboxypeptidase
MTPILAPGARIAVVASSHTPPDPARFEEGLALARGAGFDVQPLPDMLQPYRYLAGPDDHRLAQLMEALSSPEWDAVWMTRGGFGLTRLLPRLDLSAIRPKPILGFSDVTALFAALQPHGLGPLIHAPMIYSLPITDPPSWRHLVDLLAGRDLESMRGETWSPGSASGWLCGGNIAMFAALCGTPWALRPRGAIVVLEEVGEAPYRVDRLMQQLVSSGFFEGVAGVAFGQFVECDVPKGATWTVREILMEHVGPLGVPVLADLPVGHGAQNWAFPYGAAATIRDGELSWR